MYLEEKLLESYRVSRIYAKTILQTEHTIPCLAIQKIIYYCKHVCVSITMLMLLGKGSIQTSKWM